MANEKQVLEIPYGTRDYLPGEATGKRAAALAARGYEMPQGGMIRSNSQCIRK